MTPIDHDFLTLMAYADFLEENGFDVEANWIRDDIKNPELSIWEYEWRIGDGDDFVPGGGVGGGGVGGSGGLNVGGSGVGSVGGVADRHVGVGSVGGSGVGSVGGGSSGNVGGG